MTNTTPKQNRQMLDRLLKVAQLLKQAQQISTRPDDTKGQTDATPKEE